MNPLLNQRAMPLFSFDHAITFAAYIYILLYFTNDSCVQSGTDRMAYSHSGVHYKCYLHPPSWDDSRPACSMSPFTAIWGGPSGFNIFLLPVYPEALFFSSEALLRDGIRVSQNPHLLPVGACQWTPWIIMIHVCSQSQTTAVQCNQKSIWL